MTTSEYRVPGMNHERARDVELEIAAMTCASCAMRIEKKLNRLDGVNASVNYATEKATVTVPAGYDPRALIAEVENADYTAALPPHEEPATEPTSDGCGDGVLQRLRRRQQPAAAHLRNHDQRR